MDLIEAIEKRRAVRAFKPQPVTRAVINEILSVAIRAPSAINSQPWEFVVVAGDKLKTLKEKNQALRDAGEPADQFMYPGTALSDLRGVNPVRSARATGRILELMGGDNKETRIGWAKRGLTFFNAPVLIYIVMDNKYSPCSFFDIGLVTENICLTAVNHGLGTVILAQSVMYPKMIRSLLGIPESKNLVIGLALGYPDLADLANQVRSEREPLENITTWVGF